MFVIKRDGHQEPVSFDKITARIIALCKGLDPQVDPIQIAQKVVSGVYPGVTTSQLDELAAETAASCATQHPDFSKLAARISVSNHHKLTNPSFSENVRKFYHHKHPKTGLDAPLVSEELYRLCEEHGAEIDARLDYERDYMFDYFGFRTMEKSYLMRYDDEVVERPQHMFMRVALGIHGSDLLSAFQTYDLMSSRYFIHASPTLFNAGTARPQLSSCFLLTVKEDSIEGIYDTLKLCAAISKFAGGIGLSIQHIRATDSYIRGSNGTSNGIVPMLRVFNDTARYVDQGGGKRKGSFAVYIEPWHADIFSFLDLRKNHGNDLERARDLFFALWVPDLFMKRVEENGSWALFCPNECPGLVDKWGAEFEELYTRYEAEGRARQVMPAQKLWTSILQSQVETGTPYMLYKDACNGKSNQQNLGTIRSSNLCTEIIEYTSPDEVAVCNLASINLSAFVDDLTLSFNFQKLYEITKVVTRNLNKVIDRTYYPVVEAERSNKRHRPMGIGVQGLADAFCKMRYPFESENAMQLNKDIFETIYYGAVEASIELAETEGPYETYAGSPASSGKLQFDLWNITPSGTRWDWTALKARLAVSGMRNSLLMAPMPTATTAQILGNNESTEPFTSNMYNRRVLAGEFPVVNKYLLKDLLERGLWTSELRNQLIAERGSVQNIQSVPQDIKDLYKTVWEIKQKIVIDQAADRAVYICQSQSLNIHMAEPTNAKLTSMHFYSWKRGLKTGMYYLRTRPKAEAIQFTVDQGILEKSRTLIGGSPARNKIQSSIGKSPARSTQQSENEEGCASCSA